MGALLFRQGQRGIIGHITETQGLAPVAGLLMRANPTVGIANLGISAVGQAVGIVQNEQIKAALATVQSMQLGAMVLSGVGIGVSIAGFAVLNQKITRVGDQVAALDDRIKRLERSIDELRGELIAEDFDRLRTACERVDEGWNLPDPEPQWRGAAEELQGLQNRFARRVRRIVAETQELTTIEPFVEAFALAGSTRVSSRLAAGDTAAARHASESFAAESDAMTAPIGTAGLLAARLDADGITPSAAGYAAAAERARPEAEAQAAALREREAMAASTPITLQRLEQAGIAGRDWLEAARHETNSPLLFLPGDAGALS